MESVVDMVQIVENSYFVSGDAVHSAACYYESE